MRAVVFGSAGQVGWELRRSLAPVAEVIAVSRSECDLESASIVRDLLRTLKPEVIVNAAAYTLVDQAERELLAAMKLNRDAVAVLAEEACKIGSLLVHYSTDYVFDGTKGVPYTEDDTPSPLSAYGRTKLEGEQACIGSGCQYLVLRTSWVYSARGRNFLRTVLKLAAERDSLSIVDDQFGAPTWARSIADCTAHAIMQSRGELHNGCFKSAIVHLTSSGSTSWFGFANAAIECAKRLGLLPVSRVAQIRSIPTSDYPTAARRPLYSVLDCDRLMRRFGLRIPEWEIGLHLCMEELASGLQK
jgi:dTDP-4-dehydrorhamnose reductase